MTITVNQRRLAARLPKVRDTYYAIGGGIDTTTPALTRGPGTFDDCRNYELSVSGDQKRVSADRVTGYERYDGQASPSGVSYWELTFDSGSTEPSDGDQITGQSSSATGYVLEVVLSSGTWAGGDAAGTLVLGRVSGNPFTDDELLDNTTTSTSNIATANGAETENAASPDATHYTYQSLAIEDQRDQIGTVPGSGSILGVWVYKAGVYAFRNASTFAFTSGSEEPSVGDTLSGQTSSATGVVAGVVVTSGTWGGGDAAGWVVFSSTTGTWQAEVVDNDTTTTTNVMDSSEAIQTEAAMWQDSSSGWVIKYAGLVPSGRYEFVNYNFGAGQYMFGVDGKNKAFQWDGTTYTALTSNLATDTPTHIAAHANQLWLSFQSSLVHQDTGDPTASTNTDEFNTSDDVTGIVPYRRQLIVLDRNRIWDLTGTSASDFLFNEISTTSGAIEWTVQDIGLLRYLDDRGFTTVEATDAAGNFDHSTFSQKIQPIIRQKKTLVTASVLRRDRNLYRLFFSDNQAITFTVADANKVVGFTILEYLDSVEVACTGEDSSGNEISFFGSDDGYVRQFDKGNSFDGQSIEAWMQISFYHFNSPRVTKRFRRIWVEMEADREITLKFRPDFDYGSSNLAQPEDFDVTAGGGTWNVDNWNEFVWNTASTAQATGTITGKGFNMGLTIYSDSDTITNEPGHSIQGIITDYTMMRRTRG